MLLTKQISNHSVRKFWIYWTFCLLSCLYGITWNIWGILIISPLFLQTREKISEQFAQLVKLVDFMEYSRYFQEIYPSQGTKAMLTQETKKVWTLLQPKPSQATLSLRSSLRSSTGKVQQCSLTQWLHNQTSCTCAAMQWQRSSGRGAAQSSSRLSAAAGRLRSISLACVLCNTSS